MDGGDDSSLPAVRSNKKRLTDAVDEFIGFNPSDEQTRQLIKSSALWCSNSGVIKDGHSWYAQRSAAAKDFAGFRYTLKFEPRGLSRIEIKIRSNNVLVASFTKLGLKDFYQAVKQIYPDLWPPEGVFINARVDANNRWLFCITDLGNGGADDAAAAFADLSI